MKSAHDKAISARKAQHLEICLNETEYQVEGGQTEFSHFGFMHRALPELKLSDIDSSLTFLGKQISMPLFISCMTGGSDEGYRLNKILAQVAQQQKIPIGMGSIRLLFRKPEYFSHFHLKAIARDVPVLANLGAVQIRDMVHASIIEMLKKLEVDALAIHLNPAQELFQPEGDRDFTGILDGIKRFCSQSPVPVIVKETGAGIHPQEVNKLLNAGVAYVNIAGSGGTSWVRVESFRSEGALHDSAQDFADWGNPVALILGTLRAMDDAARFSIGATTVAYSQVNQDEANRRIHGHRKKTLSAYKGIFGGRILASGGIRTGLDLAKSIALGAFAAGTALPFIRAVHKSGEEGGLAYAERMRTSLHNCMLLCSCQNLSQLREHKLLVSPVMRAQIEQAMSMMVR